jgi:hypothetical protein
MSLLVASIVALGALNSGPACSYKATLPMTSLAEVREAVPIGTPWRAANDTMSLAGFSCRRTKYWAIQYGGNVALRFAATKYLECAHVSRSTFGCKRTTRVALVIVNGKVADLSYEVFYTWPPV